MHQPKPSSDFPFRFTFLSGLTFSLGVLITFLSALPFVLPHLSPSWDFASFQLAPNSILCFFLAGASLMIGSAMRRRVRSPLLLGLTGSIILTLGAVSVFGYLTHIETAYAWKRGVGMSLYGAAGFIFLGGGLIGYATWADRTPRAVAKRWIPLTVVIGIITATLCLWYALREREHLQIKRDTKVAASSVRNEILSQLESRTLMLVRMSERWKKEGKFVKEDWESDAKLSIRHFPGLQALEWVNPSFRNQWIVPFEGNQAYQGLDRGEDPLQRRALEMARDRERPFMTDSFDLMRGGKGFTLYSPIFAGREFQGFIGGVFRVHKFLDTVLQNVAIDYGMVITNQKEEIYRRAHSPTSPSDEWSRPLTLDFRGAAWKIQVWPEPSLFREVRSTLPEVILMVGILMAGLVGLLVYFAQTNFLQMREVESVNLELKKEIRERQRAEEESREMRVALENAVDGIARCDGRGRYASANRAYAEMLGLSVEEILGKDWIETILSEDHGKIQTVYQQMVLKGKDEFEARALRKDGSALHVQIVLIKAFDQKKIFNGHFCFMKDVTERKLQEALETKAQFISMVSHELRTPLQAIQEGIGIVSDGSAGELNSDQVEFLEIAKRNVERLTRLINDSLDFQKLEAGMAEYYYEEANLNELVRDVHKTMQPLLAKKGLPLTLELEEPLPKVLLDQDRITQVLINLIQNAIKFTDHGEIQVKTSGGIHHIKISVRDTGIGIREEDLPRLFRSFGQIDTDRAKRTIGSGLGLAISKKIVEQHGGKIWVESQYGQGSTFSLLLPVHSFFSPFAEGKFPDRVADTTRSE